MEKNKTSILKNVLKGVSGIKAGEAVGKGLGTIYGKLKYGMNYNNPSNKLIMDNARRQMKAENRGAIGQEEASKELAKRTKILKKKIDEMKKSKMSNK